MGVGVWDEAAVALHERDQGHVRVELVGHADPDRVPDRLQLRRRVEDVVPRVRRLDSDLVEEVPAVVHGVRDEVLRESVPLLGLRVVAALVADLPDRPKMALDLLDDLLVVDDVVLKPRLRREMAEDVVAAPGRHLGLRPSRQQCQCDVVDADVRVVLGAPLLRVDVVEPRVVGWHEVAPLDDLECVLELLVPELRHPRGGRLGERAAVEDHEPAKASAHHLAAGKAAGEP